MYQISRHCLSVTLLVGLLGCASFKNYEILSAPVVSMTHTKLPKKYRLKIGNHFVSRFCEDEKPLLNTGELIGMADQAVLKAQHKFKATHLTDTRISREGDCVVVEGNWARAKKIRKKKRRRKTASPEDGKKDFEFTNKVLLPDKKPLLNETL